MWAILCLSGLRREVDFYRCGVGIGISAGRRLFACDGLGLGEKVGMASLKNDPSHFTILNLDPDHPGGGPFVVMQMASDPEDPSFRERCFLLSKEGTWLRLIDFLGDDKGLLGRFLFSDFGEIGDFLSSVSGPPLMEEIATSREKSQQKLVEIASVGGLRSYLRELLASVPKRRG